MNSPNGVLEKIFSRPVIPIFKTAPSPRCWDSIVTKQVAFSRPTSYRITSSCPTTHGSLPHSS